MFRNEELVPLYLRGAEADEAQANWTAACTNHPSRFQCALHQLAMNTPILPQAMLTAILDGHEPEIDEIVQALLVFTLDAAALTANDLEATWAERRIAWQCCVLASLMVMTSPSR